MKKFLLCVVFGIMLLFLSCKDNQTPENPTNRTPYNPIAYILKVPELFELLILPPVIPEDNPMTEEGVSLGKRLFFDPILSADNTQACSNCHMQNHAFNDDLRFSIGIDNVEGNRNSMPIFNLAWNYKELFFWDGRTLGLEAQAEEPVINPIEMHNTWEDATQALQNDKDYPDLFYYAFGTDIITKELTAKAIAQFERTIVSANSRFDQFQNNKLVLTADETAGYLLFISEDKGDCFHCHGSINNPLWTDNDFHNTGLDSEFSDLGLETVTGNLHDRGKFKTPSLRNLVYTAPYMHDGRFETIDEVIDHYSEGLVFSPSIDPLMKNVHKGGNNLTDTEKGQLKAFLLSLTDESFITNPNFMKD